MEGFSLPSFSLGLDLDIADLPTEGEEEEEEADCHVLQSCPDQRQDEEESLRKSSIQEWEGLGGQGTLEEDPPPRFLKRLRRGPPPPSYAEAGTSRPSVDGGDVTRESPMLASLYDDIEEFSSPEKDPKHCADDHPSSQSNITCSNTKFSLLHRGFLKDNTECKHIASKIAPSSGSFSTLTGLESRNGKDIFPRLTISPIRKINLIDSDSDDPSDSKDKCSKNEEAGVSLKKGKHFQEKCSTWDARKSFLASKCQKESFWKDFSPKKNSKLETPALDEFCKEYFRPVKDQSVNHPKGEMKSSCFGSSTRLDTDDLIGGNDVLNSLNNISGKVDRNWDSSNPQPPAYKYFYHTDPRIQALVRQRLPHFIPLGMKNNTEVQQFGAENLDYMNQFSPTLAGGKAHIVTEKLSRSNSRKKQNKKSCNVVEASDASGSWVDPKCKTTVPKDARKRRVSADVRQSGHWFTDQDGRKVYVSKDGQKSTGRTAYSKYRKETGGFRKGKKKTAAAKKRQKVRR